MPVFSSLNPVLRTLGATVGLIWGIQAGCAAIAIPLQTEKFYDISASATYAAATGFSLLYPYVRAGKGLPALGAVHPRQLLMSAGVLLWSARLGYFLFTRIQKSGSDSRFDEIKKKPASFAVAWTAQAVWITLTALPVYAVNSIPVLLQPAMGYRDLAAVALWIGAFAFEVIADRQKTVWREQKDKKEHDEKFISSGLWSVSRHPNYVGEVLLWTAQYGLSLSALSAPLVAPAFLPSWFAVAAVASPLAEYALIRFVSGVPLLEKSGDKKWGKDQDWINYKKNTPVFFPGLK